MMKSLIYIANNCYKIYLCLPMIETHIEIYLSVDRYKKYGTFLDHGSHARMCSLTI